MRLPIASLCLLLLGLVACTGPSVTPAPEGPDPRVVHARGLAEQGHYREAASAYLALAGETSGERAAEYRLSAAEALLDAGVPEAAREVLAALPAARLGAETSAELAILQARLMLAERQPGQALGRVEALREDTLPERLRRRLLRLRAEAYAQERNYLEAASARVRLAYYLNRPAAIADNGGRIWALLNRLSPEVLASLAPAPPDTLGGWMELALIARHFQTDPGGLAQAIERWTARYPGHPAGPSLVPELLDSARASATWPRHVALMLPLTGRFAKAAAAVREGFIGAWYGTPEGTERPEVTIYDASPANLWGVYQQALEVGSDFAVGPLDKRSAALLAGVEQLPLPTLALNRVPPPEAAEGEDPPPWPEGLFQFGLPPEDEASRVAERAWQDGHARAAVLVPAGEWGERVWAAFDSALQAAGGRTLARETYRNEGQAISQAVARLLAVDRSKARARALARRLGERLESEPRRRQDIDFIFLAAFPREARQLRPQVLFHHGADLPIYATSHVYTGTPDPQRDRDLNGLRFGDMPWVLDPQASALRRVLSESWPDAFAGYQRLYALGVDAYRLLPRLRGLRAQGYTTLEGVTGRLSVDPEGRVHRELRWARFAHGLPVLLDTEAAPP